MAKVEEIAMSEQWLRDHASGVSKSEAWILFQGAPASGFGRVKSGVLELKLTPEGVKQFVPERYWDVRMFGELGEYHCWKGSDQKWRMRFASRCDPDWTFTTTRNYALWGTENLPKGEWFRRSEDRGATVWIPAAALPGVGEKDDVSLNAKLRIEQDDAGIAGIVDAMLCGFSIRRKNEQTAEQSRS